MKQIPIVTLKKMAPTMPPGLYDAFIANGVVNKEGSLLFIEDDKLALLKEKYSAKNRSIPPQTKVVKKTFGANPAMRQTGSIQGLGDLIYKVANPVAKAVDVVFGTNVQGCGGCAKRRTKLNEIVPFNK